MIVGKAKFKQTEKLGKRCGANDCKNKGNRIERVCP